jgi:hypothetical protein
MKLGTQRSLPGTQEDGPGGHGGTSSGEADGEPQHTAATVLDTTEREKGREVASTSL